MTLVELAFHIIKHKCMYIHTKRKRDSRLKKEKGISTTVSPRTKSMSELSTHHGSSNAHQKSSSGQTRAACRIFWLFAGKVRGDVKALHARRAERDVRRITQWAPVHRARLHVHALLIHQLQACPKGSAGVSSARNAGNTIWRSARQGCTGARVGRPNNTKAEKYSKAGKRKKNAFLLTLKTRDKKHRTITKKKKRNAETTKSKGSAAARAPLQKSRGCAKAETDRCFRWKVEAD